MTDMRDRSGNAAWKARLGIIGLSMSAIAFGAGVVHAQATVSLSPPWFASVAGSATFGHRSGAAVGVEVGRRIAHEVGLFAEAGRMFDLGTSELDARAQRIGTVIGESSDPTYRVTYMDAGVRYRFPEVRRLQPYAMAGVGAARVTTVASFAPIDPGFSAGDTEIQLGPDLTGTITKSYVTAGVGAVWNLRSRYSLDASYRYGRIAARTSEIDGDTGIDANRVRLGLVVGF